MRVKCANCGMVYDIHTSPMELRTETDRLQNAQCPECGSNAKDVVSRTEWKKGVSNE